MGIGDRLREEMLGAATIALAGNLKTGKTTLFGRMVRKERPLCLPTRQITLHVGQIHAGPYRYMIDLPGCYSLQDRSEDTAALGDLLSRGQVGGVLLVLDAKNLKNGVALALEIGRFGLPMVIALNMMDEALLRGLRIDAQKLENTLGVPVIPLVATQGRGLGALRRALPAARPLQVRVPEPAPQRGAPAALGEEDFAETEARMRLSARLIAPAVSLRAVVRSPWRARISRWTTRSLPGVPIALVVLAACYGLIGWLGAGVLVDLLEGGLFDRLLIPALQPWVDRVPWGWVRELVLGHFGIVPLGLRLSLGLVLPVLVLFFLVFSALEDSGYLTRLTLLFDRLLRRFGLNGKGVLPLVMGFSCVTMALLTTRALDSKKQRIIATLLLVMATPCAPLLGVMMAILGRLSPIATLLVLVLVVLQFLVVGSLANLFIPGQQPDFVLELPPLRWPRLHNVLHRTQFQSFWFLREAIPLFLVGSVMMFGMEKTGILDGIRALLRPALWTVLGLPPQAADVFLVALVRREAGAGMLILQAEQGLLDGLQSVVLLLALTWMLPCINTILVLFKERGAAVSALTLLVSIPYGFALCGLVRMLCQAAGLHF